jgi:TrmH family RNA methyltransferase
LKLLTLARDLGRRKARERSGLFVAEGVRAVEEVLASQVGVRGVLSGPQLADASRGRALLETILNRGVAHETVSEREFASAAQTESPQGVLAIGEIPALSLSELAVGESLMLLVLDGVQDPGNVGTILRTAAALGATATVALPGTVDLWNAKVVRSGMGAHFKHRCLHAGVDDLAGFLRAKGVTLWGADARGTAIGAQSRPPRLAIAVGNEGGGLSEAVREMASSLVALPIEGSVESLNVAVATGILLYELRA